MPKSQGGLKDEAVRSLSQLYSHEDVIKVCTDICVQFKPKL